MDNGRQRIYRTSCKIGLSDGSHTEILEGLSEGTPIVTETVLKGFESNANADEMAGGERSPFMPGPPGGDKKNRNKEILL